jgi:hypothetical protein
MTKICLRVQTIKMSEEYPLQKNCFDTQCSKRNCIIEWRIWGSRCAPLWRSPLYQQSNVPSF